MTISFDSCRVSTPFSPVESSFDGLQAETAECRTVMPGRGPAFPAELDRPDPSKLLIRIRQFVEQRVSVPTASAYTGGHEVKPRSHAIPYDTTTALHYPKEEGGGLKSVELLTDFEIQGIPCAKKSEVIFHPNRIIKASFLSRAHFFPKVKTTFPEGTPVMFRNDGSLQAVYLIKDQMVQGKKYSMNQWVYFDKSGHRATHG